MVGRLIDHQHIRAKHHHTREHTSYLLSSGEDVYGLEYTLIREQHLSKESAQIRLCLILRILTHPIKDGLAMPLEIRGIIVWEVRYAYRYTELEFSGICGILLVKNLKERADSKLITEESYLIILEYVEGKILKERITAKCFCKSLNVKYFLTGLSVHIKANERITS